MNDDTEKRIKLIYRHVTSTEIILFLFLIWICAGSPRFGMVDEVDMTDRLDMIEAKIDALQMQVNKPETE